MIEPARAMALVARHCRPSSPVWVALDDAVGCVLAADVSTRVPFPPFDNSAMDGFALRAADTRGASRERPVRLALDATVFAGDAVTRRLGPGRARAIMTGAMIPPGADVVVPIERASVHGNDVIIDEPAEKGRHIRRGGEEVHRGKRVLARGGFVGPGAVAVVASAGRDRVRVFPRPRVAVIATGSEAQPPGARLRRGQIYDSNSSLVSALIAGAGFPVVRTRRIKDHAGALRNAVRAALDDADVLVITGGVSVGQRDHARAVLERLDVEEVFWRVSQKPGKPLYFGVTGRRRVFGLPGNPASTFTCVQLYVLPALRRMAGHRVPGPVARNLTVTDMVVRDAARWRFLKANAAWSGDRFVVSPLPAQSSHMITSLPRTNALIAVEPGPGQLPAGSVVPVYLLNDPEVGA